MEARPQPVYRVGKPPDAAALEAVLYDAVRLWTPRARRFYEREGFQPTGDERFAEEIALTLVEYRVMLAA